MYSNMMLLNGKQETIMIQDLQRILCEAGSLLVIQELTATTYGDRPETAYLSVEMICGGHEFSPFFMTFPLEGSKSKESFNKFFMNRISFQEREVMTGYFRKVARTISFSGNGVPVQLQH